MSSPSVLPVVVAGALAFSLLHCGGGTTTQTATGTGGMESSCTVGTGSSSSSSSVAGSTSSTGVGGGTGIVPGPVDAVIAQMAPDSWKELPATPMADVCPTPTDHYACGAVMTAWSGGAYDSSRDRLVVFGGGHNDSWFNNVFTFDLVSMTWKRWTDFSNGLTGDTVVFLYKPPAAAP